MKAHPSPETLSDFALGKLGDAGQLAVSRHIEHCDECRGRVGQISSDSFLDRFRDLQKAGRSGPGTSQATDFVSPARSETLPPGFAENPDYEIKRELGRGGMGVVYLVHNKLMGRDEVVKVLGQHIIARRGVLDRFLREIRAVAKLRHQNIVTAYSATRIGESLVFSMEYVDGLDLARMVKAKGPLPVAHACNFVHQAALGLQHAHEEGLVHRDIKPANLMLARKGTKATIKVLDFGLAKASREEKVDTKLTSDGQALGTPDFIAPEQIRDAQSADIRADIYSLGGTLFFLLTGRPPFEATSLYELYQAHFSRDIDPLNLIRPGVPTELAALVSKMMAKEPEGRFQTPSEVAEALVPFFRHISGVIGSPKLASSEAGNTVFEGLSPITPKSEAPSFKNRDERSTSSKTLVEPSHSTARWETLIEIRDAEKSPEATNIFSESSRKPPWIWPSIAAGILSLGLIGAMLGGVFKVKTSDGTVVIRNAPKDSEVWVDGNRIEVAWPGLGKPWIINPIVGKHRLQIKKGKVVLSAKEFTLNEDQPEEVTVELVPSVPSKDLEAGHQVFSDTKPGEVGLAAKNSMPKADEGKEAPVESVPSVPVESPDADHVVASDAETGTDKDVRGPVYGEGEETIQGVQVKIGDPQITLTWDTDADLDLHVIEPGGKEIYWEHPNGDFGGHLDLDNSKGFGPENVYWRGEDAIRKKASISKGERPAGDYQWYVNYWGGLDGTVRPTTWKVRVKHAGKVEYYTGKFQRLNEESKRHTLNFEIPNSSEATNFTRIQEKSGDLTVGVRTSPKPDKPGSELEKSALADPFKSRRSREGELQEKPANTEDIGTLRPFDIPNLDNCIGFSNGSRIAPGKIFRHEDGKLIYAGTQGRVHLVDTYGNFAFRFEYLVPRDARRYGPTSNASVFVHFDDELPYQVKNVDHFVRVITFRLIDGIDFTKRDPRAIGDVGVGEFSGPKHPNQQLSALPSLGANLSLTDDKWNQAELQCEGRTMKLSVNGHIVSQIEGDRPFQGHPGLSSFGLGIQFRNIRLVPLSSPKAKSIRKGVRR